MNKSHDLDDFMKQVAAEVTAEYQRIRKRASEDPGTAGDEGEGNWAKLLAEWLPESYEVRTKGRLISHDGAMSKQVDIVVLKPSYPKRLREKKIYLAGGVAAAFECKTTLRSEHIVDATRRATDIKDLFQQRKGSPYRQLRSPLIYGLLAHSHDWKSAHSNPVENIRSTLEAADLAHTSHPRLALDLLCVADTGHWSQRTFFDPGTLNPAVKTSPRVLTVMTGATAESSRQLESFEPVGALIESIFGKAAWEDGIFRDMAEYYRRVHLGGNAQGTPRVWPMSTIDSDIAAAWPGRLRNGSNYDEWNVVFN